MKEGAGHEIEAAPFPMRPALTLLSLCDYVLSMDTDAHKLLWHGLSSITIRLTLLCSEGSGHAGSLLALSVLNHVCAAHIRAETSDVNEICRVLRAAALEELDDLQKQSQEDSQLSVWHRVGGSVKPKPGAKVVAIVEPQLDSIKTMTGVFDDAGEFYPDPGPVVRIIAPLWWTDYPVDEPDSPDNPKGRCSAPHSSSTT